MRTNGKPVRAGGGVVRRRSHGLVEVVVVHRPRYDDWTLPKGKLRDGETEESAAVREVAEETGILCEPVAELPSTSYVDGRGHPKRVRYWLMRPVDGEAREPDAEVDEVRWMPLVTAASLLSYDRDRTVVEAAAALDEPCYVVRHAKALDRARWRAEDRLRPLSKAGQRQARALAAELADAGIGTIFSSPAVRCVQTVEPLAEALGLEVRPTEALGEGAPLPEALVMVRTVAGPAVLCAHGDLIPSLVEHVREGGAEVDPVREWKKGSTWALERDAGQVMSARYVPPPR